MNSSLLTSLNKKQSSNQVQQNASEKIRNQFTFYSTVLKEYVSYLQRFENMSKEQVKEAIAPVVNQLIEQHSFGSLFVKGINEHIAKCFQHVSVDIYAQIKENANMSEDVFQFCMNDFTDGKAFDLVSPKFRSIFR
jgi:hypothetical protein